MLDLQVPSFVEEFCNVEQQFTTKEGVVPADALMLKLEE
jgi:hypothetical protein